MNNDKIIKNINKFDELIKEIGNNKVYMIIGNLNESINDNVLNNFNRIINNCNNNSIFLYIGDDDYYENDNYTLLFNRLKQINNNIKIFMIQITYSKKYKIKDFIDLVYWHNDFIYRSKYMWRGVDNNGKIYSNTKKWIEIHKNLLKSNNKGIEKIFVFGKSQITNKEIELANERNINIEYIYN